MAETPVPQDPGRDESPSRVPSWPDWMDDPAYQAARAADDEPGDPDEDEDPDEPPPGVDDEELAALIAEARQIAAEQARLGQTAVLAALGAMAAGRRGPGMPGSAQSLPGEYGSPAAGFGSGQPLDTAPGCAVLGSFAEDAAGADDRYVGASDDELAGVICGWDRVEANASARKHAAVAELIRRRPAPGAAVTGPARMPAGVSEFTDRELGAMLGVSAGEAGAVLGLAWYLEVNLPATKEAFRAGIVNHEKAAIIANATALLDSAEARAAEAMVLDRAGSLTPGGLRAAVKLAVMQVNPEKAKKRREHMAKRTRVERWAEDSGNAGLAGRELPPAEVLAADQRVTAWAKQLRKAGLEGDMDQLRARAYLDILLGTDSRPLSTGTDSPRGQDIDSAGGQDTDGTDGRDGNGGGPGGPGPHRPPGPGGPLAGVIPPGFAGRVTLTIPAATLLDRVGRPGELAGIGPIDPDPGANTRDRYQIRASADPGTGHVNVPGRCPAGSVSGVLLSTETLPVRSLLQNRCRISASPGCGTAA
jgi:hypothetical protein